MFLERWKGIPPPFSSQEGVYTRKMKGEVASEEDFAKRWWKEKKRVWMCSVLLWRAGDDPRAAGGWLLLCPSMNNKLLKRAFRNRTSDRLCSMFVCAILLFFRLLSLLCVALIIMTTHTATWVLITQIGDEYRLKLGDSTEEHQQTTANVRVRWIGEEVPLLDLHPMNIFLM